MRVVPAVRLFIEIDGQDEMVGPLNRNSVRGGYLPKSNEITRILVKR